MGPSPSGGRNMIRTRRKSERLRLKNQKNEAKKCPKSSSVIQVSEMEEGSDFQSLEMGNTSHGCSTPKAERFRIPEILTCPPAPKKKRVLPNCSFQRSPIAFFSPPELELFFFFGLPVSDISV